MTASGLSPGRVVLIDSLRRSRGTRRKRPREPWELFFGIIILLLVMLLVMR